MRPPLLKPNLRSLDVRQLPEDLVADRYSMRRSSLAFLTSIELSRMRGRMEIEVAVAMMSHQLSSCQASSGLSDP
jgi:hypothetical protein